MSNMGVYAEFHSLASKLQAKFSKSGLAQMEVFTQRQIDHHLQSSSKETIPDAERTDFVSKLLEMHKAQPDKISLENVFMACLTNVGAGSDTTSISLSAILYYLIKSPDKYKKAGFLPIENLCNQKANRPKLRDEIDESYSSGEASRPMTYQQSQRLPYLQACIKEGLRLHPATGLPLARVVPKGGARICGRFFPEGTTVGVNAWVMNRNPTVFGPDADDFRPERWLESSERASEMDRHLMSFGLGSRTCIGKNISLMEIGIALPEIVSRFDFELLKPLEELKTENVWFVKQKNFACWVSLRQK
ncbi:hypothetical protein H2204_000623 [Knufia peltigerae]|uniref:Cytochrome P450 n=1 Tax=Knufia peltigerae TaxID=1002370 RepID=A0AA38YF14_9EURO|nr:hypothetical protein H2204_000623 [Knufia peltigerae]